MKTGCSVVSLSQDHVPSPLIRLIRLYAPVMTLIYFKDDPIFLNPSPPVEVTMTQSASDPAVFTGSIPPFAGNSVMRYRYFNCLFLLLMCEEEDFHEGREFHMKVVLERSQ